MDVVTMGMMAYKIGGSAINMATKAIEISSPIGSISLKFIEGGLNAVSNVSAQNNIKLTKKLKIIDNGLSLPLSFSDNQVKGINQEIKDDLDIIKGQNEILFLSNSIKYFVDSHMMRTGIDRGISYALQYDIKAVINHIKKNNGLRFPGYLLHQCSSLADTVKEYNIFYDSILNNGIVHEWDRDNAKEFLNKKFGIDNRDSVVKSYIPFEHQIPWRREKAEIEAIERKKNSSWKTLFDSENLEEINDEAHDALFILSNELSANESLEYAISQRLESMPQKELIVKPY